jgi:hypothetical protein
MTEPLLDALNHDLPADPAPAAATAEPPRSIYDLLRARHAAPEWALLEEVGERPAGNRWADGIAINLWSSRGYAIHGFEVKVSRSDWLRELKQPAKAEALFRNCDYWWLVAEKGIVKDGELPPSWGHLERRGNSLYAVVAAPRLQPVPLSRAFFASLVRRSHEQIDRLAAAQFQDKLREARALEREHAQREIGHAKSELDAMRQRIMQFEKATGIAFDDYHINASLRTVKLAQKLEALRGFGGGDRLFGKLDELANRLEGAAASVREAIKVADLDGPAQEKA